MVPVGLQSERFAIVRELGRGGMGDVYEAHDRETGATVALKTLRQLSGESLYRFKREFRALADLQHPNLIKLGELYCEHEQWFFTMELVHGIDLLAYVWSEARGPEQTQKTPSETTRTMDTRVVAGPAEGSGSFSPAGTPLASYDEGRLRNAMAQLARAITAVHQAGRVHRDIKPSNALVATDGRVVLTDFGLADEVRALTSGRLLGTPTYMAPEQALRQPVGPEADWYAFGTLLFRALTHVPPFSGSLEDVLRAKCDQPAPAPSELVGGLPADLDALCHDLLEREPAARPTGDEVLRRIGARARAVSAVLAQGARATVFVGRADELATLDDALADADAGSAVAVAVHGEPGVGKTALVREFLRTRLESDSQRVILRGRCYQQEVVPFRAFDGIVDALSHELMTLDDRDAGALLSGGVHFLAGMFPVLTRVPIVKRLAPRSRELGSPTERRRQAFRELKAVLASLAQRSPLAVFIDDLQWADADSLDLLRELLSPPAAPTCLFLATIRSDASLGELAPLFRNVRLAGLSTGEAESLLARVWDRDPDSERVQALVAETGGHPMFLSELARHADGDDVHGRSDMHLQDVLWARIERLDAGARAALELAALAGVPVADGALVQAGASPEVLWQLLTAQLLRATRRETTRYVEPYHDRIRETIVARVGDAAPLHLRIGRALLAHTPNQELDSVIFTAVKHLNAAERLIDDPTERRGLAKLNLRTARKAKAATAYAAARDYVARASALLPPDPWDAAPDLTRAVRREEMEVSYLVGEVESAEHQFDALLDRLTSAADRADLYVAKVTLDTATGRFPAAIETARAGLRTFGVSLPGRATMPRVLAEYLAVRWAHRGTPIAELAALPETQDDDVRYALRLMMAMSPAAFFTDSTFLSLVLLKMTRMSIRHGVTNVSAYGFAGYGLVLTAAFHKESEGYECGKLALRLNERFHNQELTASLYMVNGIYLTPWMRPLGEARDQLERGIETGQRFGDTAYEAYSAGTAAIIAFNQAASLVDANTRAKASLEITRRNRDADMSAIAEVLHRYCETLLGTTADPCSLSTDDEPDDALPNSLSDEKTPIGLFYYHLLTADLHYRFGDVAEARRHLDEAERWVVGIFGVPTAAEHMLLITLVAARQYPTASFARRSRLARAMARSIKRLDHWAECCPGNFRAHALIARGERERARGRVDAALALYREAIDHAEAAGTHKHAALATELAARLCKQRGDADEAAALTARARDAYARWGAVAIAERL